MWGCSMAYGWVPVPGGWLGDQIMFLVGASFTGSCKIGPPEWCSHADWGDSHSCVTQDSSGLWAIAGLPMTSGFSLCGGLGIGSCLLCSNHGTEGTWAAAGILCPVSTLAQQCQAVL